jgi:hypothetical protein
MADVQSRGEPVAVNRAATNRPVAAWLKSAILCFLDIACLDDEH